MGPFTKVRRRRRGSRPLPGDADKRSSGNGTDVERPLAANRPLGLPDVSAGEEGPSGPSAEDLYKARRGRRERLLRLLADNRNIPRKRSDTNPRGGGDWPWPYGDPAFASGFRRADTTIDERRGAARRGERLRLPASLLRAAFPPSEFGLEADCSDSDLSAAVDQSWLAARGYVISGAAGLAGDSDADKCTAPQPISVAIPGPIAPEDEAAFWSAFAEAAFQLPESCTQAHYDACADQAWNECFAPPAAPLSTREQVWASAPSWCWVDEPFCEAFATLFEALPDNCTDQALAAALDEAWDDSQGDHWI